MIFMFVPLIAAAIPAVIGAVQSIAGGIKRRKAEKNRPDYDIPDEMYELLARSRIKASGGPAPGETEASARNDMLAANTLRSAGQSGSVAESLAGVSGQLSANNLQLQAARASYQDRQEGNVTNALSMMSKSQDQEWQMNEFAPYADKRAEGTQMIGAGMENLFGAAQMGLASGLYGLNDGLTKNQAARKAQMGGMAPLQGLSQSGLSPVNSTGFDSQITPFLGPASFDPQIDALMASYLMT